ncbi:MAG TPA: FAD-dependent thymidylate synthase [Candidatus Dormibacteraeota bacterium]|nr:FAD-dependent thymidylate synthase [Candidatus Dormibacteraeota bacterium]
MAGVRATIGGTVAGNPSEFTPAESAVLARYFTNLDRPVFALRNLPEVVKGALFSRYSRTEKSLRRVLLDEFINQPESGFDTSAGIQAEIEDLVAVRRAEEFYERVLVGYGDDSVAELAGAHVAVEQVSTLAAKALEDSRIGLSPLEKSTRYVRFDRPGPDGRHLYHRGPELSHPDYEVTADALFDTYSALIEPVTNSIRERFPLEAGETDRAWKSATRAKALDLLRGLLPAGTLTNLGMFGNGRAFEYLITKLAAHELPECRGLAIDLHRELELVIPAFVKRAVDERYGAPAAERIVRMRTGTASLAHRRGGAATGPSVRLIEHDPDAERKVVAAALFPQSDIGWDELKGDPGKVLDAVLGDRANRRQRAPRALEHAQYTFEIVANFAAYRDLHRHRMLTQDRQLLGTSLGYDLPTGLAELGQDGRFRTAIEAAAAAHARLERDTGPALAQYLVPLAFHVRWYFRVNLREVYHLCELRTTPQGHPDYRWVAQEMFKLVSQVHPRLAKYAKFVDMGPGDELERRQSERRIDEKLGALDRNH